MKKVIILAWFFAFVLVVSSQVHAWNSELDLGLSYHSGIHSKKGLDIGFNTKNETILLSARVSYAEEKNRVFENRGHVRLGYDPELSQQWSLWFFDELGYDEKRMIDVENFAGGGPKYSLFDDEQLKASLSVGLMQHHIRYEDDQIRDMIRLSLRPKVRWQISDEFSFALIAFYQPNIEDFADYIMSGEAALKYSLTQKVGLKLRVEDEYRSISKVDENNSLRTVLALSVNF